MLGGAASLFMKVMVLFQSVVFLVRSLMQRLSFFSISGLWFRGRPRYVFLETNIKDV